LLDEIAQVIKIQFNVETLQDSDMFLIVEPYTFMLFVPCLRIGEHSIGLCLDSSWGEKGG